MSFANRYNKGGFFEIDTAGMQYVSLQWIFANYGNATFVVRGMYINTKGNYGATPAVITDGAVVNLPEHLTDTVRDIIHDTEAVEDIKQGAVGFTVREYVSKNPKAKGKKCYTVNWVDIVDGTQVQAVDLVAEK